MPSHPHLWESQPPWLGQDLGPCGFPGRERKGSAAATAALCSQARAGCWKDSCWGSMCGSSLACPTFSSLQHEGAIPAPSASAPRWLPALGDACSSCCAAFILAENFLPRGCEWRLMFGGGRVWNLEGRGRGPVVLPPLPWLGKGGMRRRRVTMATWLQHGRLAVCEVQYWGLRSKVWFGLTDLNWNSLFTNGLTCLGCKSNTATPEISRTGRNHSCIYLTASKQNRNMPQHTQSARWFEAIKPFISWLK